MKRSIIALLIACIGCGLVLAAPDGEEEAAIQALILSAYRDGLCNVGDVELVKKGFHPEFRLLGIRDDALTILPIADWIKITADKKAAGKFPPKTPVNMEFPLIDVTGNAAVVKVKFWVGDKHVYTDYLSLLRFSAGWKIVNKIYTSH
jgi:hypothetical protein